DLRTVPIIFEDAAPKLRPANPAQNHEAAQLSALLDDLERLPLPSTSDPEKIAWRQSEIGALRERLVNLLRSSDWVRQFAQDAVIQCNGTPGERYSFDCLHRLLEVQVYRLANWRVSGEEINYRRFFDINDLIGLRMEDPRVFAATHQLVRRLLAA